MPVVSASHFLTTLFDEIDVASLYCSRVYTLLQYCANHRKTTYAHSNNSHDYFIFTSMGSRAVEMKKIYATLRALLDVLEILIGQSTSDRLGRQILDEVIVQSLQNPYSC